MRAVRMGERDSLQVARAASEAADRLEHEAGVALEERVDEGQLAPVVDKERVDVPALSVPEAVDAGSELLHERASCHGANGFLTPRSADSSSGKWRRSSVRIEFDSTQSMPSFV